MNKKMYSQWKKKEQKIRPKIINSHFKRYIKTFVRCAEVSGVLNGAEQHW